MKLESDSSKMDTNLLGEAPVPDDASIQEMLDTFRTLSSSTAPCPSYDFPCRHPEKYLPKDLPQNDKEYTMQDVNGRAFNICPIYYDALPFKGRETKVFAWLGLPASDKLDPVPGMVCVHGGGGTAFKEWVEQWVEKGYAAISIAVEGQTDEQLRPKSHENRAFGYFSRKQCFLDPLYDVPKSSDPPLKGSDNNPHNKNPPFWVQHSYPGPRRPDQAFGDFDEVLQDQWMFHSIADTILANTLMRNFSGKVDPLRIGLTGISWGGVITSTVAGLDNRFSHIIPIYGCGNLGHAKSYLGKGISGHINYYEKVWDACLYLPHAKMPSLWVSWPEDPHFPMINLKCSYQCIGSAYKDDASQAMISLIPGLQHGHAVGWRRPESYTFSKYVWARNGSENGPNEQIWCHQKSGSVIHHGDRTMAQVQFISSLLPFRKAELIWSPDGEDVEAGDRRWNSSPAILKPSATPHLWAAEALLPNEADAWIINLYSGLDKNSGLVVTSTYQDLKLFAFAVEVSVDDAPQTTTKRRWLW